MESESMFLYGGISGIELATDSFDLGESIVLKKTYAHLMSPCMMAFSPPGPEGYHPAPWTAAKGGFSFDIEVEISVPVTELIKGLEPREIIWWIAALLRISQAPFLIVPVISDSPFEAIPSSKKEPTIQPFEITQRILQPPNKDGRVLTDESLNWVKEKWRTGAELLVSNPKFFTALQAFDISTIRGRISASLLSVWGGLEQLFAPSRGELRFRVAALLSSYLEDDGDKRFELYKDILKLYDERSTAAHTAKEIDSGPLVKSWVIMRNALFKMIDENKIPTQNELESLLFRCDNKA